MPKDIFYLTAAIDYANGRPHLGHAYEKIGADVIARYQRLKGRRVFFMVGTDEHSLNVARQAAAAGKDPALYCAEMAETFKEAYRTLRLSHDRFIRTDEEEHRRAVIKAVERVQAKGLIYKGTYAGWYCASCEAFLDEGDLMDGRCPVHPGRTVEWVAEENWFFALSAFEEPLLRHFEANPGFLQPESRRNEVLNRLRAGLKDISISRASVDWGVPMPGAPDQVVYVWFDALINYLTGVGYAGDGEGFAEAWPPDVQIIGKDITWFHAVIWPAMLMALDLPLPERIFAHGHVNAGGQKLSKSAGNAIDPLVLVADYGLDAVRFYLMREITWGGDGEFSLKALVKCYNSHLANDYGNLLSRCTAMIRRFCGGRLPAPGERTPVDEELRVLSGEVMREYEERMERLDLSGALDSVWRLIRRANKYVDETSPWTLAKREETRSRLGTVLYGLAETLRIATIALTPFLVEGPAEFFRQLGLDHGLEELRLSYARWGLLAPGSEVREGRAVYPRLATSGEE